MKYTTAGVEIERDRARTWITLAGAADDGSLVVELLPPIAGTDAVDAVVALRGQHPIDAIGIDPRSPAATLLDGLRNEGMPLQLTDASALAVALGRFVDWTVAGRLKHRGDRALTDAVRLAAAKRTSSGAQTVDRAGDADPAPLIAAELATWALLDAKLDCVNDLGQFLGLLIRQRWLLGGSR